jgi:hypothetical protein
MFQVNPRTSAENWMERVLHCFSPLSAVLYIANPAALEKGRLSRCKKVIYFPQNTDLI